MKQKNAQPTKQDQKIDPKLTAKALVKSFNSITKFYKAAKNGPTVIEKELVEPKAKQFIQQSKAEQTKSRQQSAVNTANTLEASKSGAKGQTESKSRTQSALKPEVKQAIQGNF